MYLIPTRQTPRLGRYRGGLGIVQLPTDGGIRRSPIRIFREPIQRTITPPTEIPTPITAPVPATGATNAGTPVPIGFPQNQLFVSNDGSFWEYSSAQGGWINTGTPYNVGAAPAAAAAAPSDFGTPAAAAPAPVNVSVTAPAAESTYQSVLDWLGQKTLISNFPNWLVAGGFTLLALKFSRQGGKR